MELNTGFDGVGIDWNMSGGVQATGLHHRGKAIVPTHLARPFITMMQLMSLRQAWIGDWEPDWKNNTTSKWSIVYEECKLDVCYFYSTSHPLTFPTREMVEDFMNTFKDLLEVAKPLI